MRIACPKCLAEYEVPDSLLATGPRLLRCARCTHQFEAALPAAAPSPPAAPAAPPVPTPMPPASALPEAPPDAAPPEAPPGHSAPAEPRGFPPPLEVTAPLVERPPPGRGVARHPPAESPAPWRPGATPRHRFAATPQRRFAATVMAAWAASLVVILAAGWATYTFHAEITAAFPAAARLYRMLGLG